ncbi:Gfo/Idh/MocA family oxidoreductase [Salicibibacter halophilus]|uniref:Gfo/Idh/MocA family oxidoreductase n=1 Tax=Salicibibacter halophilus TaxID=2502791 RepID=A0A514LJA8_9BACI|nr:Gfo/Idh/MocA family oxidoreductase [Salicibibacter halophilus]QDI91934.1 Gfo/Idh/MocA family oxidoreductase [Salicibibacter halophilus]
MKIGIMGTGFSAHSHMEALKRLKGIEIMAIFSRDIEKAKKIAAHLQIPKAYDDPYKLVDDPDVEALHNCTSNYMHYEINAYALKKNKHLMTEKPLALTIGESAHLRDLAFHSDGISGVCFNYRFFPIVKQMQTNIQAGKDGFPHLVKGSYTQDWMLYESDYNWRLDQSKNGSSRTVADIGSHWCDTVQYIVGNKITSVFADLHTLHAYRFGESEKFAVETEDAGHVLVRFENGMKGSFTVSQVTAGRKNHFDFELSLKDAAYYWNQENPNSLWIGKRNEPNQELLKDAALLDSESRTLAHYPGGHQEGWPDGLKNLFIDFYKTIEGDEKKSGSFATIEDGHQIMQIIDGIMKSHKTEQWVSIASNDGRNS